MNYFEFRQQLLQDSFTKDEEFHRLRKEDLRCAKAYEQAMAFEKTLKSAFEIKTPDNLKDSIVLRQATQQPATRSIRHYAIAATVVLSFVVASIAWHVKQPVEQYVIKQSGHVEQFIAASIAMESNVSMSLSQQPMSLDEVKKVFAEFQVTVSNDLGRVHFIHDCHTPGGTGVHMVIVTSQGPITIYYMPKTKLDKQRIDFEIDGSKAVLLAMHKGSVAIVADTYQQLASIEPVLQNNLLFL
ncbi:MAG: DUF3379 domain-containing protein [Proteobacteria bacterium]|nr:DUF3379 domain-containing protein [Pseudomonadota bacterium]